MKKTITLLLLSVVCLQILLAQQKRLVEGVVQDSASGLPLASASIYLYRTQSRTLSDSRGKFTIAATSLKDGLSVSYSGYKSKKVIVDDSLSKFIISLVPLDTELNDVTINTGYQRFKPNEVTGSYVVIDNKMLNQQTGLNILDRLNGVTSSLLFNVEKQNNNPQNTTNITIRGLSTINGPLDPLIVVDNFIYDGDINNINPNDVESVTVLKDAAAESIWGARAGNGVIVITTKKGKFNQKLQVDFSSDIISTNKPDLYYNPQISSADYINFEQNLFTQGYYDGDFTNYTHPAISPAVQVFEDRKNGLISEEDSATQIEALAKTDSRVQYEKYYYRTGVTQQYALNLRGGSDNIGWLVAGTYDKSVDNVRADYNKVNLRFENTYRPIKNITVNAGVYYTNSKNISGVSQYKDVITINGTRQVPYLNIAGTDGQPVPVPQFYDTRYLDTVGGGKLLNWNYYPLSDWKHNVTSVNTEELLAHIGLDYQIVQGLDINLLYQYQKQRTETTGLGDTASYYARNLINLFSQVNYATGTVNYLVPLGGILNKSYSNLNSYNFRGQLNFARTFNRIHRINAIAGMEIRDEWNTGNSAEYYGYTAEPLTYATSLDFSDYYPTITGDYQTIPYNISLSKTENRFISYFTNASYTFRDKYIFSGSMRRDGSNILGANTNDKWKPLWSAGLGWQLSKENFYHIRWLPYLKLSATYGVSGNVDLSKSAVPVAVYGTSSQTNLKTEQVTVLNNPDLTWERSYQLNLKIDFASFKNTLSGSFEYYHKKGTDLYAPTPYDYTTWGVSGTITANVADMKGNGVDVVLHSNNIQRGVTWTTDFLFNYNTAITTAYYTTSATRVSDLIGGGTTITPIIGKPLYGIAAYKWGGLDDQGNPIGYIHNTLSENYTAITQNAADSGLSGGSFVYLGSANPVYFGSVMNSFSYKGISLSFNILYKLGYYLFKPSLSYSYLAQSGIGVDYDKRWQQAGDEAKTDVPSFVYPLNSDRDAFYNSSETNVIKGDNIRLQFINLAYSFTGKKKKTPFKSLQVYINAANMGILWRANKDHVDPDFVNSIPQPKTYTVGLRTNF